MCEGEPAHLPLSMGNSLSCTSSVQSRPDLFPPHSITQHYSLEQYHVMGSRILSRSFTVGRWGDEESGGYEESMDTGADPGKVGEDSASRDKIGTKGDNGEAEDLGDCEDDDDDSAATAMVPMADMLNARYGLENVSIISQILSAAHARPLTG
jgi:SET domain-containing protein 6